MEVKIVAKYKIFSGPLLVWKPFWVELKPDPKEESLDWRVIKTISKRETRICNMRPMFMR